MSAADSPFAFQSWDELIDEQVGLRFPHASFCSQMIQQLRVGWIKFHTSRKARPFVRTLKEQVIKLNYSLVQIEEESIPQHARKQDRTETLHDYYRFCLLD